MKNIAKGKTQTAKNNNNNKKKIALVFSCFWLQKLLLFFLYSLGHLALRKSEPPSCRIK